MIQDSEKSDFLEKFYGTYIDQLMTVIEAGTDKYAVSFPTLFVFSGTRVVPLS